MKASTYLTEEEQQAVVSALKAAEAHTTGEIVPVIAVSSERYDRAESIVGLLCALLLLGTVWLGYQGVRLQEIQWGADPTLKLGLGLSVLILVLGFAIGNLLATFIPTLRLPFIRKVEMERAVSSRSAECFFRFGIGRTRAATGILLYVSLFERMLVVQGDHAINEKIDQADWDGVRDLVLEGIKQGSPAKGLIAGIERCGALLGKHFPPQTNDENELPDTIHFIEGL